MDQPSDADRVRELLGREPQGPYEVVVRDARGDPVVLKNGPFMSDGTPMPTRYWLISPDEIRRIGTLEAAGGVRAAEAAIDPAELADAHARYAAERDADVAPDHDGPRPSGGVAGTRVGVKCLHAHWAWHLAGGDDPVGRWIRAELAASGRELVRDRAARFVVGPLTTVVLLSDGAAAEIPFGASNLTEAWLSDADPPRPQDLTNALGSIDDHLDDIEREHPMFQTVDTVLLEGPAIEALARLEVGSDVTPASVTLDRSSAEEVFRMVATENRAQRAHNPGLPSDAVGTIVATCVIVLAVMRRLELPTVILMTEPS